MKVEIKIPEKLNDLKLYQYQKYCKLDPDLEERYMNEQIVKIFADIPRPEVLPFNTVNEIVTNVKLSLRQEGELINRFKLHGVEFGMIPNLESMSFGEYIDLTENISKWETFEYAMSILYRPIVKSSEKFYEIEEYENSAKYADVMKDAPMDVVYGAVVFFYQLMSDLKSHFLNSLPETLMDSKIFQNGQTFQKNGDGLEALTSLLKEMSVDTKPYLHYPSTYALPNLALIGIENNLKQKN